MKIVAINGSPKGEASNTNVMVSAFLKGARTAGAETVNIFLAQKEIQHCRGCHSCWLNHPGQCVIEDDMMEVLSLVGGARVIVLATPVYFENISGMLKVFMDRLTMTGNPHSQKASREKSEPSKPVETTTPKFVMIANCGYPDQTEFQVISHWIQRVALKTHTDLIGEIYAPQGKFLTDPPEELRPALSNYLQLLEKAGNEIATHLKLSDSTNKQLEQSFIANNTVFKKESQ
ncbi:flavodoxin family protein [Desulforamulus ruminis]|uniref:NADPH-dependent FMN reductase n=1 Tax=Desulforamulus ruminis (strain ATCC 23193 / DSM 2154 / NCIMB 8452 / DL) TaxID=696281 RepID=F6DRD7_DESRL|nr:flavodoxin family protein [Desulforamulus ruminis]AEG60972.1 NADPH-dependent FMN reductase [Desulforamulus ruminis DSM 2154]